jgi:hypothetical protein
MNTLVALGGAVVAVIAVGFAAIRSLSSQKKPLPSKWNQALAELCQQLGLEHQPNPKFYDRAAGEVGGRRVDVSVDVDTKGGGVNYWMKVEVDLRSGPSLLLKSRGSAELRHESAAGSPTPVGDPQFDAAIDLRGASPVLLQALHAQPELRTMVLGVIGGGATVSRDDLVYRTKTMPNGAQDVRVWLDPMLELARRLDDPTGSHQAPATGTAAAVQLSRVGKLPREQRLPHYQQFLQQVGSQIGPGQAIANHNDNEAEWRGSYQGLPMRIKHSFSGVEIEVKLNNPHGRVSFQWDASKAAEQTAVDAWDERDSVYVFVGKGVYLEGSQADVDLEAARLRSLGDQLTNAVAQAMPAERMRYFRLYNDRVWVDYRQDLDEMLDPEGQLVRGAQLAGWAAQIVQSIPPNPELQQVTHHGWQAGGLAPVQKVKCGYCYTLYLWRMGVVACPNCGAPPQG